MYYVASADLVFEYLKSKKAVYTIYLCYVSSTDHVLSMQKKLTVYELVISDATTHRSNRSMNCQIHLLIDLIDRRHTPFDC